MANLLFTAFYSIVLLTIACRAEDYESAEYFTEYPEGTGSSEPPCANRGDNSDCLETESSTLKNEVGIYSANLEALFGSEELVSERVYRWIDVHSPGYWMIEQAAHNIEIGIAAGKQQRDLKPDDIHWCQMALDLMKTEMETLTTAKEASFYRTVQNKRGDLDCMLGRAKVNEAFDKLERCSRSYFCPSCLGQLWKEISRNYDQTPSCDIRQALDVLVLFDNHYKNLEKDVNDEIRLDYLETITIPLHLSVLANCGEDNCENEYVCFTPSNEEIENLIRTLDHQLDTGLNNITQIPALFQLQHDLARVSKKRTDLDTLSRITLTTNLVDTYMNMLDRTIGTKSDYWKQVTDAGKTKTMENLLFTSESYIGDASSLILHRNKTFQRDYGSVKVKLVKVNQTFDDKPQVKFSFDGSEIWTNVDEDTVNGNLSVFAIHYNSWKESLMSSQNSSLEPEAFENRTFVGRGGIVSLSTRVNDEKKSVPVMYKINFSGDDNVGNTTDATRYRCLSCQYLDRESGEWRSTGCQVVGADAQGVTCNCNHTTNFAAFMSPYSPEYSISERQEKWLNVMEYIGSSLSIVSLVATLVVFYLVRKAVRNDRMKAHVNLSVALICLHALQLGSDFATANDRSCLVVTVLTHYLILATFMWMFVEGIFLYLYVVQVFIHSRMDNSCWMYLVGWGLPVGIVATAAGIGIPSDTYVEKKEKPCPEGELIYPPNSLGSYKICWLDSQSGMTWSFIGPALLIIFFNFVILAKVVQVLVKMSKRQNARSAFTNNVGSTRKSYSSEAYSTSSKLAKQPPIIASSVTKPTPSNMYFNSPKSDSNEDINMDTLHGAHKQSVPANIVHSRTASHCHSQNNLVDSSPVSTTNHNAFVNDVKTAVKGALVLLPLLGLPWLLGVFGYANFTLTVLFVLLNSVQGLAIFLVYCVFNGEVQRALKRYAVQRQIGFPRDRIPSTSSGKSIFRSWRRRSTHVSTLPSSG